MIIKDHMLIGENITFKSTPNTSGVFAPGNLKALVIHYTAGSSVAGAMDTLTNPKSKASAHLIIGRDGSIVQLAPFDQITWHAGKSQWEAMNGLNQYSIGIELANAGLLTQTNDGYLSWFNKVYDESNVIKAIHRNQTHAQHWHQYTEKQLEITRTVCALLIETYGLQYLLGHEEISPGRKLDPGPAFPLDNFRDELFNNESDKASIEHKNQYFEVSAQNLNIRTKPGLEHSKLNFQLTKGTLVEKLEDKGKWIRVRVEVEGWVHGDYLKPMD